MMCCQIEILSSPVRCNLRAVVGLCHYLIRQTSLNIYSKSIHRAKYIFDEQSLMLSFSCFDFIISSVFVFHAASKSIMRTDGCAWTSESPHSGGDNEGLVNNSL